MPVVLLFMRVAWQATTSRLVSAMIALSNEGGLEHMGFTREMLGEKIQDEAFVDWICERDGVFRFVVYQGMAAMDEDIDSLELSVRSYNCLRRAGYSTINSVVNDIDRREDFAKIRCCGRKSANEIMLKLFLYTYKNLRPEKRKAYLDKVRDMN